VPATVKDNIAMAGVSSRRGSLVMPDEPVPYDAPSTARLREAGCVILGKTTLPEMGWIGVGDCPLTGITRNPWDTRMTPGGSSSGAAAAAALGMGTLHIGTDGAGSIRIPSSFTGIFGLKPSFGRVPAYPASPFAVLSHVGPMTRNVADAAAMLNALARPDERDMFAWNTPAPDYRVGLCDGVKGLRVAFSPRLGFVERIDPEVEQLVAEAALVLAEMGAHVEEADPGFPDPFGIIEPMWFAGAHAALAGVPDADRASMDPGLVAVAKAGEGVSGAAYLAALGRRTEVAAAMNRLHARYDLLLTPAMPLPAFEAGLDAPEGWERPGPLAWCGWAPFCYPFNLTQAPAASVPCGFTSHGLPVGLQIVGPVRADQLVLRAARAFEAARPFRMPHAPNPTHRPAATPAA
jgi:aspartyl-tRNA(Asn)/glutamyl-tRNA(Gln) amidotransferase subunit A